MTERRDGDGEQPTLERLATLVEQRSNATVWRKFCVAQATLRNTAIERKREQTTQRIFLTGLVSQLPER